ncbi:MAG TPA: TlpA disulfide reductase family protein [Bryobacteraceae bacterium]|jgi:peroxiredoxin|nr:TlpA disulfide reductase family protein [Bryobacteraceae bacterium]
MYSPVRRRVLIGAAAACAAAGVYLLWPLAAHVAAKAILDAHAVHQLNRAPDFTLTDANSRRVSLSDYRGKVVVLNFWATWCGPCKIEIPWFIEFQKEYEARGFTVLGVSMDDDGWKVINPFAAAVRINYPIVLGDEKVNMLYGGIDALPTTIVIGRDGSVAYVHAGLIDKAEYQKEIVRLLGVAVQRNS